MNVTFDPTTRQVLCLFLNPISTNISRECKAILTYGPNCDQEIGVYSNSSTSVSVTTPQLDFTDEVFEYCLFVTAVDDTITVTVERILLNIGMLCKESHNSIAISIILCRSECASPGVIDCGIGGYHHSSAIDNSDYCDHLDMYACTSSSQKHCIP